MTTMTEIHDADLPWQGVAWVQTLEIRDRKRSDFQRISNKETVRTPLIDTMAEAMSDLFPEIPIEVEAGIGKSWAEK